MDILPALTKWLDTVPKKLQPEMRFEKILRFIILCSRLKSNILLSQPAEHPVNKPPRVLPQSVHLFLAGACSIPDDPREIIEGLWSCVRHLVWDKNLFSTDPTFPMQDHISHGYKHGIGEFWI